MRNIDVVEDLDGIWSRNFDVFFDNFLNGIGAWDLNLLYHLNVPVDGKKID